MRKLSFQELSLKELLVIPLCILFYMKLRYKIALLAIVSCIAAGGFIFQQARDKPEQETYQALNQLRDNIMDYEDGLKYGGEIKELSDIYKDIDAQNSSSGRLVRATASSDIDVDYWGNQYFIQDAGDIRKLCSSGGASEGCKYFVLLPHREQTYSKEDEQLAKSDPTPVQINFVPKSLDEIPEDQKGNDTQNAKN